MKSIENNIGGKNGGIPESIFKSQYNESFSGNSGQTRLHAQIDENQIRIHDEKNPDFKFIAFILDDDPNTVAFSIESRGYNGKLNQKHPDIYPRELIKQSLIHFQKNGHNIENIRAYWHKSDDDTLSDNYDQYQKNIRTKNPTTEDMINAASTTWSGQLFTQLGFNKITSIQVDNYTRALVVMFSK